jgi:hypothetical protein
MRSEGCACEAIVSSAARTHGIRNVSASCPRCLSGQGKGRERTNGALVTMRDRRQDDGRLALESFGAAIDHGLHRLHAFFRVDHVIEGGVHPTTSFDRVKAGDDKIKLRVEGGGMVLDFVEVTAKV